MALSIALARRNGLIWDAVFGAEFARDYKPKPAVYLSAVAALKLQPENVLMVACHSSDLAAAASCGLRTAHIARPDERGLGRGEAHPEVQVDFSATDLSDLARQLASVAPSHQYVCMAASVRRIHPDGAGRIDRDPVRPA